MVLTALDIQTENLFTRESSGGAELGNYKNHAEELRKTDAFKDISFDHGLYFRYNITTKVYTHHFDHNFAKAMYV